MRVSLLFTVLAALIGASLGQTCSTAPTCPTSGLVSVPNPWYSLAFTTDPRNNAGVTNPLYSWVQQDTNADNCASFHQGLLVLNGSTVNTLDGNGPSVNLSASTGSLSVGTALPGYIGGLGSGSYTFATVGWSFELTFKAASSGDSVAWSKIYDLGNTKPTGLECDGDIILGWSGSTTRTDFTTCIRATQQSITGVIPTTVVGQWYHVVVVLQQSPDGRSTYSAYVNGALVSSRATSQTIVNQFRDRASLGRSTWNDKYWNGTIDTFNIYDVALTNDQVSATYYEQMGNCSITRAANTYPALSSTVPAATYTADFATNPVVTGSQFSWAQQDAQDQSCSIQSRHQGLLVLAGNGNVFQPTTGQYVNLSSTSGSNFAGTTLPTFGGVTAGAGVVANQTAGFSIEVTFKPHFLNYGGKVFNFGNTISSSSGCSAGDIWFGWNGNSLNQQVYTCSSTGTIGVFNPAPVISLHTWTHAVIVVAAQSNNQATWYLYLNGNLTNVAQNMPLPASVQRQNNMLGRSNFVGGTDTYWSGEIDTLKMYNLALQQSQVTQLAGTALYGSSSATSGVSTCAQAIPTSAVVPSSALYYGTTFSSDPRTFAGGASVANYRWLASDSNDTLANQAAHQGLLLLGPGAGAGNPVQYVNFSASSGTSSIGQVLPSFGGLGTGSFSNGTAGWTFELTFKALPTATSNISAGGNQNGMNWAKIYDFGNGQTGNQVCQNDILYGFNSNNQYMTFQTCDVQGGQTTLGDVTQRRVEFNTWYHSVITLQLVPGGSWASYYLNGALVENKTLSYFPLLAPRTNAQFGKSSWPDAYYNGIVDTFNLYSQSLNSAQVAALYAGSNAVASSSSSGAANPTLSSSSSTSAGSSSSSSLLVSSLFSSSSFSSSAAASSNSSSSSSTSSPSSSAGASSSSSSAGPAPLSSVLLTIPTVTLPAGVNVSTIGTFKDNFATDFAANLIVAQQLTGVTVDQIKQYLTVTVDAFPDARRRLLQTNTTESAVSVLIDGAISTLSGVTVTALQLATSVANRIANNDFTATRSGATVPQQTVHVVTLASSSTGQGDGNAAAALAPSMLVAVFAALVALLF